MVSDLNEMAGYGLGNPKQRSGKKLIFPSEDSRVPIGRYKVCFNIYPSGDEQMPVIREGKTPVAVRYSGTLYKRKYFLADREDVERLLSNQ